MILLTQQPAAHTDIARGDLAPGPRGHRLIGMLPEVLRDPLRAVTRIADEHGDCACIEVGPERFYLLSRPEHAQYVLRDRAANFVKDGSLWKAAELLVGKGLGTSDGSLWLRQRRMMQPQFHRQRLAGIASIMTEAIAGELDRLSARADGQTTVELVQELKSMATAVFLRAMFGTSVSRAEMAVITDGINHAFRHLSRVMWLGFLPSWAPLPGGRAFRRHVEGIDAIVQRILRERRSEGGTREDLLDLLLMARDEHGEAMSEKQVRDEVMTLLVAAHETTATALAWTFYLLRRHPESGARLDAEVKSVLGGRTPGFEDLTRLSYARMAFHEAMRLYPPLWLTVRRAKEDDSIDGYRVPAGSFVALLPYRIHRHPSAWEDADAFTPERFTPAGMASQPKGAYLPFGLGAHQCIGNNLAIMQAQLILAMTAQRYRIELASGQEVEPEGVIALRPKHGIEATLRGVVS
ncbi:MAG: cytochrome P450 [Minicystis sp.]